MVQMAMMPMTDRSAVGTIGPSWQPPVRTQGASRPERDLQRFAGLSKRSQ
jgi:hypothetical protein